MSTTGRPDADTPATSDIADRLRNAEFVRLVATRTGDAIAASGLLADALDVQGIPYQMSAVKLPDDTERATDTDLTIGLGRPMAEADVTFGDSVISASSSAFGVASELGAVDPVLALAGVCAAGEKPDGELLAAANERGIERRPGVGVPTADLADGLAHSTLIHAPFSSSVETAADALAGLDLSEPLEDSDRRSVASLAAITVAGEGTPRAAEQVEQFLRPFSGPGTPFATIEGHADVLDATARQRPDLALPLVLGAVEPETALEAWREHARTAHEAVRTSSTGRYDGLFVVQCRSEAPIGTVARLVRDFRSPEPLVLVVTDGEAVALSTTGPGDDTPNVGAGIEKAAAAIDGRGAGTPTEGRAQFDVEPTEFVVAFREEL